MTEVADVLSRYGIDMSETEVAAVLDNAFRSMPMAAAAVPSAGAVAYLSEHGGPTAVATIQSWSPEDEQHHRAHSAMSDAARLVAGTLTVDQAAGQLGVDASRVRHFINDLPPRLYAVKVGHRRRIPAWQIHDGSLLPGLQLVVRSIPAEVHPLDVDGLMATEQDELASRTPAEHLASGGDPALVAGLVADLGRW